ncbi:cellulase family glycosylhydrolase [Leptolyngbya sp. FACHB-261]|uniref:cellulase family glycosylhydrolase n=1 Tax=Leptolyngbya sp. FACHB-261 TaxID=2692806 RepID=UPI001684C727|nr:cellulase family glycosylhydrolase [Leptolyngbya sp. FACHB-261]MBD2105046.1 cellulase family glycosylhydrolase [Leptolyngbya sp. FACHB-261]
MNIRLLVFFNLIWFLLGSPVQAQFRTQRGRILDARGRDFIPVGVSVGNMFEKFADANNPSPIEGNRTTAQDIAAMRRACFNTVRVPVTEKFSLPRGYDARGRLVTNPFYDPNYDARVKAFINRINAAGMLAILDAHTGYLDITADRSTNYLPSRNTLLFWQRWSRWLAQQNRVWAELYNEPDPDNRRAPFWQGRSYSWNQVWTLWRDGDLASGHVGYQNLLNAVRAGGYRGIVVLSGRYNSSVFSGIPSLSDPANNTVYQVHRYSNTNNVNTSDIANSRDLRSLQSYGRPWYFGEFGPYSGSANRDYSWPSKIIAYARARRVGALGWHWIANPSRLPRNDYGAMFVDRTRFALTPQHGQVISAYACQLRR